MAEMDEGGMIPEVRVFTSRELARIDQLSEHEFGIPPIVLMENAGAGLAGIVLETWDHANEQHPDQNRPDQHRDGMLPRVMIACGPGNNGGDGLVAARHLHNEGCHVTVGIVGDRRSLPPDAATNLRIVERMGLSVLPQLSSPLSSVGQHDRFDVVVDALLGTGLSRPVGGELAECIGAIEQHRDFGAVVIAADLPSGLACDSGEVMGRCVAADITASFVGIKRGFLQLTAQQSIGRVHVVPIGAPRELVERFGQPLEGDVGLWLGEDQPIEGDQGPAWDETDVPPSFGARTDRG